MQLAIFEQVTVDRASRSVARAGTVLRIEPKALDLLLLLMEQRERCVLKAELHAALWPALRVSSASLPRLIKELRRALGDDAEAPRIIRTLHGRGYQFVAPLRLLQTARPGASTHREPARTLSHLGSHVDRHLPLLQRAVSTNIPTLLEGAAGTGKQTLARALHRWSGREELRFVSCPGLSEAELQALYPAEPAHSLPQQAQRCCVVLSEVSELSSGAQRWLLRRLDASTDSDHGHQPICVISTSQSSLRELTLEGKFRADLCARLAGVTLRIPALSERRSELRSALDYFVSKYADGRSVSFSAGALAALERHDWPLNLSQFEATVRALIWLLPTDSVQVSASAVRSYLGAPALSRDRLPRDPRSAASRS